MEPKLEDVLFLTKNCQHKLVYDNKVFSKLLCTRSGSNSDLCPEVKISSELLENLVKSDLKGKYYPGFIKYFKHYSEVCILKSAKNAKKSVNLRIKGNSLLAKEEHNVDIHEETWKLLSKSIALAPPGSKELVLAYESRSKILLHIKKYEGCINDIDRALSLTEFDLLKVKLLCRKMTCFVAMNKDVTEKENLWEILKNYIDQTDGAFKDERFLRMIEQAKSDVYIQPDTKLKEEQKDFPLTSFGNKTIMLNKEGHMIADRDYETGKAIIVTKPIIASVNPDHFYAYCSHCLSFMWAGIPCDQCSVCMYCSEECKQEAWEKYHALECKVNPHIDFSYSIYYKFKNSLKIFLMGVREFGSIPKLLEKVREVEQLKDDPNFMKRETLYDSEFLNFYTLPTKVFTDSCSLSNCAKNTCLLMAYMTQVLGEVFEKNVGIMAGKELAKDKDFVHSAVVLMKIFMLCRLYMDYPNVKRSPECTKYNSKNECIKKRCCPVGKIFHFFKGMIKKSCNPNISICKSGNGKVIYYCVQPIQKLGVITIEETVPFYSGGMIKRHSLKPVVPSIHEFCRCTACVKDWPAIFTKKELQKYLDKFQRRSSKIRTKGMELTEKYFRDDEVDDPEKYFIYDLEAFEELAKDTNTVVSLCGQPSFASCWMIGNFIIAFGLLYGDFSARSRIPSDC